MQVLVHPEGQGRISEVFPEVGFPLAGTGYDKKQTEKPDQLPGLFPVHDEGV
jgi:hypothetical protein